MTKEEALYRWVLPALQRTWNKEKVEEIVGVLEQETGISVLDEIEKEVYQKDYYLYVDDIVENIRQIFRKLRGQK